jgi:hypothetical protein
VYPEIEPGEFIVRTNDLLRPVSGRSLVTTNVTPTVWKPPWMGIGGVRPPLPSWLPISESQS